MLKIARQTTNAKSKIEGRRKCLPFTGTNPMTGKITTYLWSAHPHVNKAFVEHERIVK